MNDNEEGGQPAATGLTLVSTFEDNAECATELANGATDTPRAISQRFEEFHRENPRVYRTLVELARAWVQKTGRHELGIASLYERARWELVLATNDPDFKLNNDFRAYYARLIMIQESDLQDLFELRKSAADSWLDQRAA